MKGERSGRISRRGFLAAAAAAAAALLGRRLRRPRRARDAALKEADFYSEHGLAG